MLTQKTGNVRIDTLLGEAVSKGFSVETSKASWKLKDPEGNELGFDPGYQKSIPLLEKVLEQALQWSTLCAPSHSV